KGGVSCSGSANAWRLLPEVEGIVAMALHARCKASADRPLLVGRRCAWREGGVRPWCVRHIGRVRILDRGNVGTVGVEGGWDGSGTGTGDRRGKFKLGCLALRTWSEPFSLKDLRRLGTKWRRHGVDRVGAPGQSWLHGEVIAWQGAEIQCHSTKNITREHMISEVHRSDLDPHIGHCVLGRERDGRRPVVGS